MNYLLTYVNTSPSRWCTSHDQPTYSNWQLTETRDHRILQIIPLESNPSSQTDMHWNFPFILHLTVIFWSQLNNYVMDFYSKKSMELLCFKTVGWSSLVVQDIRATYSMLWKKPSKLNWGQPSWSGITDLLKPHGYIQFSWLLNTILTHFLAFFHLYVYKPWPHTESDCFDFWSWSGVEHHINEQ
jgi:hypothetical protein